MVLDLIVICFVVLHSSSTPINRDLLRQVMMMALDDGRKPIMGNSSCLQSA